jgi:hypothetical protein
MCGKFHRLLQFCLQEYSVSMKTIYKTNKERIRAAQDQKRVNKLIVKLLELLIKHYGVGPVSDTEEILERIREVNDSVDIIARHLKHEADARKQSPVPSK